MSELENLRSFVKAMVWLFVVALTAGLAWLACWGFCVEFRARYLVGVHCENVDDTDTERRPKMSETKFTPGPWVIVKVGGEYTIRLTHTADGRKITKIICKMPKRIRRDKLLANAALIAAAPKMYKALEDCKRLFAEMGATVYAESKLC